MTTFSYTLDPSVDERPRLGLIVLQADETIEAEARQFFGSKDLELYTSRVPSGADVTLESLGQMRAALPRAAAILPGTREYDVIGYACTSGAAVIGSGVIADLVLQGQGARQVTDPLKALTVWCRAHNVRTLSLLSPYIEPVSDALRAALARAEIEVHALGTFDVQEEERVARIDEASIVQAATELCAQTDSDALFISCTNLRTQGILTQLQTQTMRPVVSSNSAMFWHMSQIAKTE